MGTGRLEAFSDGVIAIIITIMVLELKAPQAENLGALIPLLPALLSYLLSFIYVGIYWNNHHHMLHAVHRVSGMSLWANLRFLFWLSLVPFVTRWIGETHYATPPVVAYGGVLLMCALSWSILCWAFVRQQGKQSALAAAVGRGRKELVSMVLYVLGIVIAIAGPWLWNESRGNWGGMAGCMFYSIVAAIWFVPDRRIERVLANESKNA